jgi:hypothetical protein
LLNLPQICNLWHHLQFDANTCRKFATCGFSPQFKSSPAFFTQLVQVCNPRYPAAEYFKVYLTGFNF